MRALTVASLAACILLASLPLALHADAREGSLATPVVGARTDDGSRVVEWHGRSALHVKGLCLPAPRACLGSNETEDGRFFLSAPGSAGELLVTWRAVNDSLRVLRVHVAGRVVEGESPLAIDILGAPAGEQRVRVEPVRAIAGAWDQDVEWVATFHLDRPAELVRATGRSAYSAGPGCLLALCGQTLRHASDPLVVPWTARGELIASWEPTEGEQRVRIAGTSVVAEGAPPLALDLSGLEAGEWRVQVEPVLAAIPLSTQAIVWNATLEPAR